MGLVCLTSMLSSYLCFTGAGSSGAGTKPKPKRAKVINVFMCEDGVKRDKTALQEEVEYAVHIKQNEKEDRLRKKTLTMRDLHISGISK